MRKFNVFLSAAVKGRTMGYAVHVTLMGRWEMAKKKPVRRWHESGECGGGLDWCGSGYGCVILNTKETLGNMKGDEVDQLSDYQLTNNESALCSYSTIQQPSWLSTWGNPRVRPPLPKQGCWHRKFLISCFVCICHCFVIRATRTTWQPRWLSRYSDVLRADVPKIIRAHSDELEAQCFLCSVNRVYFPEEKRPGRGAERPPPRMYSYTSTSLLCRHGM